ncbi:MAG: nucleoside-diphosphate kinase [Candidatus Cloacimonadota bacterium]|nr:nucleoside-diphosphate kinase [Candidatus Cloacimonadota bacterium]
MEHDTLFLIKPNVTAQKKIGEILQIVEKNGFTIEMLKMFQMNQETAEKFYAEHKGKSFYHRLLDFMTSGKTVAAVLHRNNAVPVLRELIGDTDFHKARPGTIRFLYADSITRNAVHASDSIESANREINIIFPDYNR